MSALDLSNGYRTAEADLCCQGLPFYKAHHLLDQAAQRYQERGVKATSHSQASFGFVPVEQAA